MIITKKRIRLLLTFFLLSVIYCPLDAKSIKSVKYLYKKNNHVEVTRIDYLQNATVLHFVTEKNVGPTFRIGHGIYIVGDDGTRHHAIGTTAIKLDSLYVLCKGQRMKFSISFEPVGESNLALDITEPESFAIYGLHDGKEGLSVPVVKGEYDKSEENNMFFQSLDIEIDGILHDEDNTLGKVIYANYLSNLRKSKDMYADQYAKADADGRFTMRFTMQHPRQFSFIMPNVGGSIIAHPGDKLSVEMYGNSEGKELVYRSLTGRKTFNKLANAPGRFYDDSKYIRNITSDFANFGYIEHYAGLMERYDFELEYANYICWHYKLSPHETQLYLANVNGYYVYTLLETDCRIQTRYYESISEENKKINGKTFYAGAILPDEEKDRYKDYVRHMDFSYLNRIDPNNYFYMINGWYQWVYEMISNIHSVKQCINTVLTKDSFPWKEIIEKQKKEVNRIIGCEGMTTCLEYIIAYSAPSVWRRYPCTDEQYQQIRQIMSHPCTSKLLDYNYNIHIKG